MPSLAKILRAKLCKGYSRSNLNNMRKFYLLCPICQTLSDKLSRSYICKLITIDDGLERSFYEKECTASRWDVRSLRRQMDSALYLRLVVRTRFGQAHLRRSSNLCIASFMASLRKCFRENSTTICLMAKSSVYAAAQRKSLNWFAPNLLHDILSAKR